ncbi:MAG TPA: squalene synthase HpnC [Gammaproteobacteria bacterium]
MAITTHESAAMNHPTLEQAYAHCLSLARSHYENFPVASLILPRKMRRAVAVIYAFARIADDLADEGPGDVDERLARLSDYHTKLERMAANQAVDDPVFIALADTVRQHNLPLQLLFDLLSAFRQDVTQKCYTNFAALRDYCRRSADPVGRLLLHLNGNADTTNLTLSDQICSSLQLINFLQDLDQDYRENNRIYIPLDEMTQHGVDESWFQQRRTDAAMQALLALQIGRARRMMLAGAALGERLQGRFGFEIRLIVQGGLAVLDRLEQQRADLFSRPRLRRSDIILMALRAL